jgi:long-chain-fatty-acid--CoA ligase ACSBG
MLSHDNYTWTCEQSFLTFFQMNPNVQMGDERIVSYLPLSHVAAQQVDLTGAIFSGAHVYVAAPDAL